MKYLKAKEVSVKRVVPKGSLGTLEKVTKKTVKGKTGKANAKSIMNNIM